MAETRLRRKHRFFLLKRAGRQCIPGLWLETSQPGSQLGEEEGAGVESGWLVRWPDGHVRLYY